MEDPPVTDPGATPIAVLGLGTMGRPFAVNLAAAGRDVSVWNRSPGPARSLSDHGAHVAFTARDAVGDAGVVITVFSTPEVTRELAFGDQGFADDLAPDAVWIQMATIGPVATSALASELARRRPDVALVDAPVLGTRQPAEQGTVTVFASGDDDVRERTDPVFDIIGAKTVHLGPLGRGSALKLTINAWLAMVMQGTAETIALGRELGIEPGELWENLDGGPLASPYFGAKLKKIAADDRTTDMAMRWGAKDAGLAAAAGSTELPMLATVARQWKAATDAGFGDDDIAAAYRFLTHEPDAE